MRKRRLHCFNLLLLAILAILCLSAIAVAGAGILLPQRAEQVFGPPSPGLSRLQQIRLAARLLLSANDLTLPENAYGSEQAFDVQLGESPRLIAARLEEQGLIGNAEAFRDYLVYSGYDTTIQAGEYRLSPKMTPIEIARQLQDATPKEVALNVLPGWRLEEIAATLPTSGLEINSQEFLSATATIPSGYDFLEDMPQGATLEGFLFPGKYILPREAGTRELIGALLERFGTTVDLETRQGFTRQEMTLFQAVTLASIVQREAVSEAEMPIIASVFYNRLKANMRLDSDPTVQYAIGYNPAQKTWWTNPLSTLDLQVASPYNTYQNVGLPPGPIGNPGFTALRAVAFPAQTPYYYFRAACDGNGKHAFSETYEQHLEKGCP
jgi:UPF0755 protein